MANKNAVYEYRRLLREYGFRQKRDCSEEENARFHEMEKNGETIPDNVGRYLDENEQPTDKFYLIEKDDMTHEERMEYLAMKQCRDSHTIKNCVVFLAIVTAVGVICSVLGFLG
ncbi:MAG: hypothetical protein ACI4Q4_00490 [Oscillospiraceae bacterium]